MAEAVRRCSTSALRRRSPRQTLKICACQSRSTAAVAARHCRRGRPHTTVTISSISSTGPPVVKIGLDRAQDEGARAEQLARAVWPPVLSAVLTAPSARRDATGRLLDAVSDRTSRVAACEASGTVGPAGGRELGDEVLECAREVAPLCRRDQADGTHVQLVTRPMDRPQRPVRRPAAADAATHGGVSRARRVRRTGSSPAHAGTRLEMDMVPMLDRTTIPRHGAWAASTAQPSLISSLRRPRRAPNLSRRSLAGLGS